MRDHAVNPVIAELASVGDRDMAFPLPHGRGDEFHHGSPLRLGIVTVFCDANV